MSGYWRTGQDDQNDLSTWLLEKEKERLLRYIQEISRETYGNYNTIDGREKERLEKISYLCREAFRDPI